MRASSPFYPTFLLCISINAPRATISYDECERCSSPDCQVLEDYRARLFEAESSLNEIITQSMQLVAGTATPPSLAPPPPSAPPAAAYIVFNPLAHDRVELVNMCALLRANTGRVELTMQSDPSRALPDASTYRPPCLMPPEQPCRLEQPPLPLHYISLKCSSGPNRRQ